MNGMVWKSIEARDCHLKEDKLFLENLTGNKKKLSLILMFNYFSYNSTDRKI